MSHIQVRLAGGTKPPSVLFRPFEVFRDVIFRTKILWNLLRDNEGALVPLLAVKLGKLTREIRRIEKVRLHRLQVGPPGDQLLMGHPGIPPPVAE